ncbi:unnamed protein product [Gadus morhua 'NCC']
MLSARPSQGHTPAGALGSERGGGLDTSTLPIQPPLCAGSERNCMENQCNRNPIPPSSPCRRGTGWQASNGARHGGLVAHTDTLSRVLAPAGCCLGLGGEKAQEEPSVTRKTGSEGDVTPASSPAVRVGIGREIAPRWVQREGKTKG